MLSLAFLVIAVIDMAVLVWAIGLYRKYPSTGLLLAIIPITLLWFDNVTIGIGGYFGQESDLPLNLNRVRFVAHYVALPMSIIGVGAIARQAGFAWAQPKIVMGAFCVLATWFIGHDLWLFYNADLYPSCFADTLRYTTHVAEYTACGEDAPIGAGTPIFPYPAITLSIMLIALGIMLWVRFNWKWLTLCSVFALGFFGVPYASTGGIFSNAGEPIITGAMVAAAAYVSKRFGNHASAG
ncbi:MAG: hypothetical protein OEU86_07470 [Gammaproteobacteria bacterium]|nr:hypothetical protein [Gammaproteobacteria bacterium]